MKKPLFLLFLALGFFLIFPSKNPSENDCHIIKGKVQDIRHQPLEGVSVRLKEPDILGFTIGTGEFVLKVPGEPRDITLSFEHEGYHSFNLRVPADRVGKFQSVVLIPREYLQEEISVTALNQEVKTIDVPAAESRVSQLEIQEKIPENVMETMLNTPGIHFIGSGGFSITPSIRGVARRRVLMLVDGMRITGDRRAGVSAELISPELVEKIEVVRSSSSVIYGSDAMGGVIQLLTRTTDTGKSLKNALNLSLGTGEGRLNGGLAINQKIFSAELSSAFQISQAGNYRTPTEEIYHSGYTFYSGMLTLHQGNANRDFYLSYIGGYGTDVGKPLRENTPDDYTRVSEEGEHYIRFQYIENKLLEDGNLGMMFYVNPSLYALEKYSADSQVFEYSSTRGYNLGAKAIFKKPINQNLSFQAGVDWYGRRDFDFENSIEEPDRLETTFPLLNGRQDDLSLFLTADYCGIPGMDIMGGVRYTWFSVKARVGDAEKNRESDSPSYFLGLTKKFGKSVSIFFNLGKAFRLPGMSELFYTGLTGRKYVIGNPDLVPESSLNLDMGIKVFFKKFFLGTYLFSNRINDMIERFKNEEGIYTYDNIIRGDIYGGEVECQFFPTKNIELFGHYCYYQGRDSELDDPLNDVPPPQLFLGGKIMLDRFWLEINHVHSFKKDDPGPAEVENNAYQVLNLKAGYYFSSHFFLNLKITNFFNRLYYPNADPDIPPAKGIDLSLGLHYYF